MRGGQRHHALMYGVPAQIIQLFGIRLLDGNALLLCFGNQCADASRMRASCYIQAVDRPAAAQRFCDGVPAGDHVFPAAALLFFIHKHISLLPVS